MEEEEKVTEEINQYTFCVLLSEDFFCYTLKNLQTDNDFFCREKRNLYKFYFYYRLHIKTTKVTEIFFLWMFNKNK